MKRDRGKRTFRKRQVALVLFLFFFTLPLSGCWNNVELNDVRRAAAIGIDLDEEGRYLITVRITTPTQQGGAGGGQGKGSAPTAVVLQTTGYTIFDAVRNMIAHAGFKLYYQHLFFIVLGRELAEKDIIGPLDFFMRDHESRLRSWVLIADGKAETVIKAPGIAHPLPAVEVDKTMKSGKAIGKYPAVELIDLMRMMSTKDKTGYLPRIRVLHTEKKPYVHVLETAIIKDGKVVGDLNETETRGLLWVRKEIQNPVVPVPLDKPEHYATIEVLRSKTKIQPSFDGKRLRMKITVTPSGNIGEFQSPYPLNLQSFHALEKKLDETVKQEIQTAIAKAQNNKADIFGFEEYVHRAYPKEWKTWKKNWPDRFAKLSVVVEVKSRLLQNGLEYEQLRSRGE